MGSTVKQLLAKLAIWLLKRYGGDVISLDKGVLTLLPTASAFVKALEVAASPGTTGEYKRHVAYARLQKKHPTAVKRDIALAIELAVREL